MNTLTLVLAIFLIIILTKNRKKHPSWKDKARIILSFALFLVSAKVALLTMIIRDSVILTDSNLVHQLGIVPLIIGAFFLISFTILSFAAWKKKGFDNLNRSPKRGLIEELKVWLFFGLIIGMIYGAIFMSVYKLIDGLIFGMGFALIVGTATGYPIEFRRRLTLK